ncbi:Sugar kinase of the NBD/HSP70 family, may contain an N-terminal HTH domain [Actinopolymorpha singaporensis]|uniref:Sugar kinase of the NBD/HSP70 family, may contain an N-terminal HTH domain n=1 Tax=Actinopolymorpha singaporensis TaxID=117157 RepID=A0A1H1UNZ4_9ACTN|nr:Sugar kinase of the NBD/HSP70 family, may contain an N-terminal HTH domain [Actinopolymorpha singaporensis]
MAPLFDPHQAKCLDRTPHARVTGRAFQCLRKLSFQYAPLVTQSRAVPEDAVFARPSVTEVMATLVRHGPMSRLAVAERAGLTSPSVTKAVRLLMDAGYLADVAAEVRGEPEPTRMGRPTHVLTLRPERELFAGVNITGEAVIGTVVDLGGTTRAHRRVQCRSHDPHDVFAVVRTLMAAMSRSLGRRSRRLHTICVALSGDVDRARGTSRYSPFLDWHEVDVAGPVERLTGIRTILDNDVHALTVAEFWSGAGLGAESLALVTVGSGVGCGLMLDGKIVRGAFDVAGELGHVILEADGPDCRCGRRGCVEAYAAEHAISRRVSAGLKRETTFDEAVALATAGRQEARAAFVEAGTALGRGIATLANITGPQRIVVSPTREAAFDLMAGSLRRSYAACAYGAASRARLVIRPTGEDDWSRGAAVAAIEARFSQP